MLLTFGRWRLANSQMLMAKSKLINSNNKYRDGVKMSWYKKVVLFLSAVGPGLFLVGYNIGTGSVTSMASAGANYGMGLSWAVLVSCIFTYILLLRIIFWVCSMADDSLKNKWPLLPPPKVDGHKYEYRRPDPCIVCLS